MQPKGCLIACGKPRERIRARLEQHLACKVDWPDIEPSDTLKELRAKLNQASVLIVGSRFTRKHVRLLVKEARKRGIVVVTLSAGYSAATIIRETARLGVIVEGNVNA